MVGIRSIGWYLPTGRRDLPEIAQAYGVDIRALQDFGLKAQAVAGAGAEDQPVAMAARAAGSALAAAGLTAADVDLLIFCGMTRDYPSPWVAAFGVLRELGASAATGFDLSNRCPGILDGLWVAAQLLRAGTFRTAVVCSGERYDWLLGPPRVPLQLSDVAYSAGAAAATVTATADNEILAYTHFTNHELDLNDQNTPHAGGSRVPLEEGLERGLHRWQNTMTLAQIHTLRRFLIEADRRNLDAVKRAAGFDAVDFVVTAPLDVKAQTEGLRNLGFNPERQTFFSLPYFGHIGGADLLISLAAAIAQGSTTGPRLVMMARSVVSSNAIAVKGRHEQLGIRIDGSPLRS